MRIEEVTVSRTKRVNLGNYESAEMFVALKAAVDSTESAKDVGNTLADLTKTLIAEHAPKDLEQRAKEKSKPGSTTKPAETSTTVPPATSTTSNAPADASPAPTGDHLAVKVTGEKLKTDVEGRKYLKAHGFRYQPIEAAWTGRILRDPKEIAALNVWTMSRGLEIEFAPVET